MKLASNFSAFLPDDETDSLMLTHGSKYQSGKLAVAMQYVDRRRTALDIGAHCGLWTSQLAEIFNEVICFEPLPKHIECWRENVNKRENVILHETALGYEAGSCGIKVETGVSGRSHVDGAGDLRMSVLDDYKLQNIDLIQVDVEGYEYFVVTGGEKTIRENKPIIIVEQKKGLGKRYGLGDKDAVEFLENLGAVVMTEVAGDFIMGWP